MSRGNELKTCSVDACDLPCKAKGLCRMHYLRCYRTGSTDDPVETRFWSLIDKTSGAPCWLWTGLILDDGYGRYAMRQAHRRVYERIVGPIPPGLVLDHLCRVRRCVNPAHLEPVTPRENTKRGELGRFWGYVPAPRPPKAEKPTVCSQPECSRAPYKRDLCRPHYKVWLADPDRTSPLVAANNATTVERFWLKVDRRSPHECWLWLASENGWGYGQFHPVRGKNIGAHKFSYELIHGPVPEGLEVHHKCQTRLCVNPRHLEAVTRSVNIRARVVRQDLQSPGI